MAAFVSALIAAGAGEQDEQETFDSKAFTARLKESSRLHYELSMRHYNDALKIMPRVEDIDVIEPTTGLTALAMAAQDETADAYDMVRALVVKFGADPATVDKQGLTALHYAVNAGNLAAVEFLINHGAEVDAAPDIPGCLENCVKITPLYMGYQKGRTRIASLLEDYDAEPIDSRTRSDLDLQAKLRETLATMRRSVPDGIADKDKVYAKPL